MKIHDFLEHHGISRNPFAEEDAQTDIVFKNHCIDNTFHVGWDKVIGDPSDPSTSIVFGEKGAGKTALKLQIGSHVAQHNESHSASKLFLINYDDFNPFLDRFRDHFGARFRRADKLLSAWRLWDHMDAILSVGITQLCDELTADNTTISKSKLRNMPKHLRRDLLLLAAFYDHPKSESNTVRWHQLRRRLGVWSLKSKIPAALGIFGTVLVGVLFGVAQWQRSGLGGEESAPTLTVPLLLGWGYLLIFAIGWSAWIVKAVQRTWLSGAICRRLRVGKRHVNPLRRLLMNFTNRDLLSQPMPNKDRTDDRYELLGKLQNVLENLDYSGILVLMDRLDEPHLVNGQTELIKLFLWPILDNKFLKQPGIGIKMMLPIELRRYVDREDRDFYQRARLDKQNMIPSLQWTGSALYDLASSRIGAVAIQGQSPTLRQLFDESVTDQRLIEGFQSLRVPRHLFKFLYRTLIAHCNTHTDDAPSYQIASHEFESSLAIYAKEIEAADAGVGV